MARKAPRDEIETANGAHPLTQGRLLALLPTGKVALEAPDLIEQGQYLVVGQQLAAAAVVTLTIAMIYRLVEWISTFQFQGKQN